MGSTSVLKNLCLNSFAQCALLQTSYMPVYSYAQKQFAVQSFTVFFPPSKSIYLNKKNEVQQSMHVGFFTFFFFFLKTKGNVAWNYL